MVHSAPAVRSGGGIVSVLAVAGIVGALMQTLVVPLVGELPRLLNASAADTSWVLTATLLVGAVATPVVGKLGDLYGKRRMMLVCSIPLMAGSVVCALSGSLIPMIVGRGMQGLGVGMIPLGVSALRDLLPPQRIGPAIALMSSSMGIGGALGLPISAAVAEYADWRMLFWGSAALSVLVAVLIWTLVPATPATARGRLDVVGAVGLGTALVCLLLGVSKGADWGWTSGTTLGLLGAAVVVLLLWGLFELRVRDPLVDLRVTARPQVLFTNLASILVGFAMYAQSLVVMQILQLPVATGYGLGQSMLAAGLWLAPAGLMMMAVSSLGARLSAARGPKISLFAGALVIAAGYGASLGLMDWAWGLMIASCVANIGVGLAYGAMPALIMGAVPQTETASANSFNTLMRSIGTSFSAAVVGVVLAQMSTTLGGHSLPSEGGFRTALLIGCGVALAASLVTLTLPNPRPTTPQPSAAELATGPAAGLAAGPIAGAVAGPVAGPVAGSAADLAAGSGAGLGSGAAVGPVGGPAAGSVAGPQLGAGASTADPLPSRAAQSDAVPQALAGGAQAGADPRVAAAQAAAGLQALVGAQAWAGTQAAAAAQASAGPQAADPGHVTGPHSASSPHPASGPHSASGAYLASGPRSAAGSYAGAGANADAIADAGAESGAGAGADAGAGASTGAGSGGGFSYRASAGDVRVADGEPGRRSSGEATQPFGRVAQPMPIVHEELGPWGDAFRSREERVAPEGAGRPDPSSAYLPQDRPTADELAELRWLRRENAELRRVNLELRGECATVRDENAEIRAENTGLREENTELRRELDVLMGSVSAWVKNLADR
ncbi:MFS transporter [Nonomuraea fuscirosea]|uniref:MFS transporter n=1 Tax=Nonomuraea fuscirosea TaxID=1291556 RepID=UPI0037106124